MIQREEFVWWRAVRCKLALNTTGRFQLLMGIATRDHVAAILNSILAYNCPIWHSSLTRQSLATHVQ